ncbi:hypothetical protein [Nocardioides dilutus]
MGYTTDFIGHIDIEPALNQDEIEYLTAFSESRRYDRVDGPYAVPGNPSAENQAGRADVDIDRYNRPGRGQPQLWCQWEPCWTGCCLSFDGREKFYEPVAWLRYLINHFLRPGAIASESGLPAFEHFTFDHRLEGMVVGCRRDTKRLFAITVTDNEVREEELRRGLSEYARRPPLPYEAAIDRLAAQARPRRWRRTPAGEQSGVVDLAGRRASGD